MEVAGQEIRLPRLETASDVFRLTLLVLSPYILWQYSNKFLGMSADYLTSMARDITIKDPVTLEPTQMNPSYFPMESLTAIFGGLILICYLLVQNDFKKLQRLEYYVGLILGLLIVFLKALFIDEYDTSSCQTGMFGDPLCILRAKFTFASTFKLILTGASLGVFLSWTIGFVWRKCTTSAFGIFTFLICYLLVNPIPMVGITVLELTPGDQVPFFFLGGAMVAALLLLQNNIPSVLSSFLPPFKKPQDWRESLSLKSEFVTSGTGISLVYITMFAVITFNMSMLPFVSENIPAFLSALTLLAIVSWIVVLSRETAKPEIQSKRTAALGFLVLFPFFSYLLLRVLFLMNDASDPVMLNRWEIRYEFMEKVNTFKINPWPIEVEPNVDSRWLFLKAGIINSVRVTLVSIVLCTILGTIIGVTRLSQNKLASFMSTVYVEVFRNLPLAVLLFLIGTQIGLQFPQFIDEQTIGGIDCIETNELGECTITTAPVYWSNQGIWFVDVASYQALLVGLVGLALLRVFLRSKDRTEPKSTDLPDDALGFLRRPFSPLGWKAEPIAGDLFVIVSSLICIITLVPFISTSTGAPDQNLGQIASTALPSLVSIVLLVYSFFVNTNIDDDGMNSLEIDDSDEGIRMRFTIWVAAFAVAAGITLAGGIYDVGEALSVPEYTKDYDYDGDIDAPGSWRIIDGTGFEITPFFLAMILGLTLFTASTVAEIVRGSIQSLPRGQVEAAISLSLNPYQRLRLVILPQALRSMVPLMNNQFMNVWKNSSLAIVVAYTDIFYVILVMMNNVGKLIPLFLLLLVTYQAGSLTISAIMNWYNSRVTSVKI